MADENLKFIRKSQINLQDGTVISGLRTSFRIERKIGGDLSTAIITIYNASPEIRNDLLTPGTTFGFDAGYKETLSSVFKGIIRNTNAYRDGTDILTQIFAADLNSQIMPFISKTISNSKSLIDLISDLAFEADIDIAVMNIQGESQVGSITFLTSFRDIMRELAETFDFSWMIYDGLLYVFESETGNTQKPVFEVSAKTGLLETPILTEKGIDVKLLLESSIRPMDIYDVKSGGLQLSQAGLEFNTLVTTGFGRQQALEVIHTGDTHTNMWFTEIQGLRL